ncbi:MAG: hypothetical protein ACJ8LG_15550 [Massilia sp.]
MSDDDTVTLAISVFDGRSLFANEVYVGQRQLKDAVAGLHRFKDQVRGGIHDLTFGHFGPEYGHGGFHARLHFRNGQLYVTVRVQSGFHEFGMKQVAAEATLYLTSEPALLDDFARGLRAISDGQRDDAVLEGL